MKPIEMEFRLAPDVAEWLRREAEVQTKILGGAVRRGGNGIVTPSQVVEQLVGNARKRALDLTDEQIDRIRTALREYQPLAESGAPCVA